MPVTRKAFLTSSDQRRYKLWSCKNACDALSYLLDTIYTRFGTKLYRQIVGSLMNRNCVPLVADLFYVATYCKSKNYANIRIQIQPSKPKRETINITNGQNAKRGYGQPSEQLFPKRWPLSNPNRTKIK